MLLTIVDALEKADQQLLIYLNNKHHPWLDELMYHATDKFYWIPLYVLFLYLIYRKFGIKNTLIIILGIALLITLCDRISVVAFKNIFKRFRPCHNTEIQSHLLLVREYCAGRYSFVSSHATNFFGLATYMSLVLKPRFIYIYLLLLWAAFISYTRIYLGVHYPFDIICGAILGIAIAFLVYYFVNILLMQRISLKK